ncbi:hypothetical protein HNP86_001855 [Methanococcus maripaludis]|uniref:Uncharacterized protein n=1 Tax=Methanococcus maripaludis TaxID=39152 RepID=A0A7J9P0Z1_METMI|nr:hypothetical protein [Methanococcus maripaludis]MBA2851696.1 hypothetical protein [Methanococcus maripaludis]
MIEIKIIPGLVVKRQERSMLCAIVESENGCMVQVKCNSLSYYFSMSTPDSTRTAVTKLRMFATKSISAMFLFMTNMNPQIPLIVTHRDNLGPETFIIEHRIAKPPFVIDIDNHSDYKIIHLGSSPMLLNSKNEKVIKHGINIFEPPLTVKELFNYLRKHGRVYEGMLKMMYTNQGMVTNAFYIEDYDSYVIVTDDYIFSEKTIAVDDYTFVVNESEPLLDGIIDTTTTYGLCHINDDFSFSTCESQEDIEVFKNILEKNYVSKVV